MTYTEFLDHFDTAITILTWIVVGLIVLLLIAPDKQPDEHENTDDVRG